MFETDESKLSETARAALDALRHCTLIELHTIRIHFLGLIQREVGARTVAECRERVRAEVRGGAELSPAMDDVVTLTDVAPPVVVDGTVVPDDEDDEVLEPTPLEPRDPACGPGWGEGVGPVS